MDNLSSVILKKSEEWLSKKIVNEVNEINMGPCMKFSEEVKEDFHGDCTLLSNHDFIFNQENWYDIEGEVIWNVEKLTDVGALLNGLTSSDLNKKILGFHQWIYCQGKHYDVECPEGVTNMLELPFFKYYLKEKPVAQKTSIPSFLWKRD